jgi:DNA polymerase-1
MSAVGLAARLSISAGEAEDLLLKYFAAMPQVEEFLLKSERLALEKGETRTILGRRLLFPPLPSADVGTANRLKRVARNMPIQGTGSDILKLALAGIDERFRREHADACLVNCVHDEVVAECAEKDLEAVRYAVQREMVDAAEQLLTDVPVEVNIFHGENWAG